MAGTRHLATNRVFFRTGIGVVSAPLQRDQQGQTHELWQRFKLQLSFYPFVDRKDLIDAVSGINDMSLRGPEFADDTLLEPEMT